MWGLGELFALIAKDSGNEFLIKLATGGGLPRFDGALGIFGNFDWYKWKWLIPLMAAGIALALIYKLFDTITRFFADKIKDYRIVSCLIAGIAVAVLGFLLPYTMFSRKPGMAVLIMLLCFPLTYVIPMLISAFISAKIPTPFKAVEE